MADPLDGTPWANLGQGQERNATAAAVQAYRDLIGREPNQQELSLVLPSFYGPDPNFTNVSGGRSFVAQMAQSKKDPFEDKRKELEGKAPEFFGGVDQSFQSVLGRQATDEEKKHFGSLLASGDLDAYSLGQWLQQLPENVRKQDQEFRQQLSGELQSQDKQYYEQNILPAIQAQFAQQGRSVDSSGFASAAAQAAKLQNQDRERYLSNISAQQYQGRQGAAREDYLTNLSRTYGAQDYRQGRADTLADRSQQRLYDIQDYNTQAQLYNQYLSKYGKRNNGLGGLIGGLGGAAFGATPWGRASGGSQVWSGLGSGFGQAGQSYFGGGY